MSIPISFTHRAKSKEAKYPTQISAEDLDRNFTFCDLQVSDADEQGNPQPWTVSETTGPSGYKQKTLTFSPAPPTDGGTYVLGFSAGRFQWIATESC